MHTAPNWLSERQTNIFNNFFFYYYYFFVAPTAARPEVAYVKVKKELSFCPIQTLSVAPVIIGKRLTSSEIKVPHHCQSENWETKRKKTNRLLVLQTNSNCRIAARSYDITAVEISRARQSFAVNSLVSFVIDSTTWNTVTSTGWEMAKTEGGLFSHSLQ